MHDIDKFSERLTEIRTEKNYTDWDLSNRTQIPIAAIRGFEQGSLRPSLNQLIRLSEALSITIDWLLGGGGEK